MSSQHNIVLTYILLVFIWSTTPLAIVWTVSDLNVMWALLLRFFIALPLAALLLLVLKIKFPVDRVALHSYVAGAFSLVGSQAFTYAAAQYLSSGMLALMFGLAPIMAGLIGRFVFGQHLQRVQWFGMLVAVCGLGIICFMNDAGQQIHPLGIGLMLVSVFNYALSIFWVKKIAAKVEPMAQATGSILVSSLVMLLFIPFIWQYIPDHLPSTKSLSALLYTVVMASLIAMFCYFKLVQNIQATTLSLTTVMTPMLAMLFGALFNREQPSAWVFVGALVLIGGVMLYFYQDLVASRRRAQRLKQLNMR
ncbi:EamA domain-containing membrane protein RarD [Acinetobacter calcoaceticus]|uniref:EamA domain-containing membrane protein RarD n=1 Tax=Acinetobacter calcoaceticus TaxID=471 RepID=A0A4R1XSF8_ACICA|nr:EamA domain-containing membrane protein RarD [Acinetobacter calcoaceticus]